MTNCRRGPTCQSLARPGRATAELHARRLHHLGHVAIELHFDLFRTTQAVGTREDARHHDRLSRLRDCNVLIRFSSPANTSAATNTTRAQRLIVVGIDLLLHYSRRVSFMTAPDGLCVSVSVFPFTANSC